MRAGLPFMAPPQTGQVEQWREMRLAGHRYTILMDWSGDSDMLPGAPEGMPAILDHKTSSNPRMYGVGLAKDPIQDPQVILYSAFTLVDTRADQVFCRWLYYPTKVKRKKAIPSDFIVDRSAVERAFRDQILPVSNLLKKTIAERPDPNTLAPNALACQDFGRVCWYSEDNGGPCRLTDQDRKDALRLDLIDDLGGEDMGLRGVAKKAAEAQAPAPAPEAGINPPDKQEELPAELEVEAKPKAKPKTATKTKAAKPAAGAGSQAEAIGAGVLAILDAVKERWG